MPIPEYCNVLIQFKLTIEIFSVLEVFIQETFPHELNVVLFVVIVIVFFFFESYVDFERDGNVELLLIYAKSSNKSIDGNEVALKAP